MADPVSESIPLGKMVSSLSKTVDDIKRVLE